MGSKSYKIGGCHLFWLWLFAFVGTITGIIGLVLGSYATSQVNNNIANSLTSLQTQITTIDGLDATYTATTRKDDAWLTCEQMYAYLLSNISLAIDDYTSNSTAFNLTVTNMFNNLVVSSFNYTVGATTYTGVTGMVNYIGGWNNATTSDNRYPLVSTLDSYSDTGVLRTLVLGGKYLDIWSVANATQVTGTNLDMGYTQIRCVEQSAGVFKFTDGALTLGTSARSL